jgi:SAM-dependent methyltransferase
MPRALVPVDVTSWRERWSQVMAGFVPGLATLEQTVCRAAEATLGRSPERVLDLGGGPGLLAELMANRWPGAAVTLLDLDPVLLTLARAALPAGVRVLDADLSAPGWTAEAGGGYDLILAVMTMHYLSPDDARALYRDAGTALTPGGLLLVADLMPDDGIALLMEALDPADGEAAAELAWARWWSEISHAEGFEPLFSRRDQMFRQRPPADFTAPVSWHISAARHAGFDEAGIVWRCGRHAALAALR